MLPRKLQLVLEAEVEEEVVVGVVQEEVGEVVEEEGVEDSEKALSACENSGKRDRCQRLQSDGCLRVVGRTGQIVLGERMGRIKQNWRTTWLFGVKLAIYYTHQVDFNVE